MPSQEEIDTWVKNVISGEYNTGRYKSAFEHFSEYAKMGNATAQYYLGKMYYEGQCVGGSRNYDIAAEWYRKSAEQGDADAQCELGRMYRIGLGVSQDYAKAEEWYRKSAEQGNAKAVEWYRKSAEQGNTDGQYALGYMYHNGIGVSKDYVKAAEWYRKAARRDMRARKVLASPMFKFKTFITKIFN